MKFKLLLTFSDQTIYLVLVNQKAFFIQSFLSKNLSELFWENFDQILNENNLSYDQIEAVYLDNGPGKFNTIRLLTLIAKIFCMQQKIDLFTISHLKLLTLLYNQNVSIKADQKHYYVGAAINSQFSEQVCDLNEYEAWKNNFQSFIELQTNPELNVKKIISLFDQFAKVEDIKKLKPNYLKKPI